MTSHYRTRGFIFKKEDRLEADRIFSIFSEDFGRIEVIGRAIRKINSKLKSGLDIFSLSEVEFIEGKNKKTLTDALFIERFRNICQSQESFETAEKISSLVDIFVKGEEKDSELFRLLDDVFYKLNNQQFYSLNSSSSKRISSFQMLYFYFFWNFVSKLGYGPELLNCPLCRQKLNPDKLYFSSSDGGVICGKCYPLKNGFIEIKADLVKILRLILNGDWNTISRLKIENNVMKLLEEVLENYNNYLSSYYLSKNKL